MFTYVLLTIAVFIAPLALSFDKKVAFYTYWKPLIISMIPVSAIYIIWDVIVTDLGHWWFSDQYSGVVTILGLPLGEWLFFFVVPYACIFIYEVVRAYFPYKRSNNKKAIRTIAYAVILGGIILFFVFAHKGYSRLAMISISVYVILTLILAPHLFSEIHTLWYFLLSLVAFLIVNSVLTGLPIVLYSPEAIWGIRIFTIPLEDAFYNTSMLGLFLTSYVTCKKFFPPSKQRGNK
ncbi:MAG: lycopene cyclase domain-containing protein [Spirochaetia bacterium]|nr:lycopene cyclase domain-containing protein [Spirochaetia bacterium]